MERTAEKKRGTAPLRSRQRDREQKDRNAVLFLLALSFSLGGLLGCLLGGRFPAEAWITGFLEGARQDAVQPALWREIWVVFRWPAAAAALGLLPRAGLTIPALVLLRGFVLSYGISAMMTSGGALWCAGLLFGPSCLLTVPVLFVLAEEGLLRKTGSLGSSLTLRTLACLPALLVCVFLNQLVVPPLLTWYLS